jgi:hypothetical protein
MSYEPSSPPANLPTKIVNTLNESDSEQLRDVATYAEALAEHKEREARLRSRQNKKRSKNDQTIFRMTSRPKQRSRSKRSTIIATTTGSGGRERRSGLSTRAQSTRTSKTR